MQDRLRFVRKELGLTQKGFAEKLGVTQAALNELEHGRSGLTKSRISQICHIFNINREWLEAGRGPIFLEGKTPDEEDAAVFTRVLKRLVKGLSKEDQRVVVEAAESLLREISPSSFSAPKQPPKTTPAAKNPPKNNPPCMELNVTNVHGNLLGVAFDHSAGAGRHVTISDSSHGNVLEKLPPEELPPKTTPRRGRPRKNPPQD